MQVASGGVHPAARLRVCADCALVTDQIIGGIHSDLACMRCGRAPCVGAIVALPPAPPRQRRGTREAQGRDVQRPSRPPSKMQQAADVVARMLASGPRPSSEIRDEVCGRLGLSDGALHRAAQHLGVVITRTGDGDPRHRTWSLPTTSQDCKVIS